MVEDWGDVPLVLLGAGPSLAGFDFDALRRLQDDSACRVVAIQGAIKVASWAAAGFVADRLFLRKEAVFLRETPVPLIVAVQPIHANTTMVPKGALVLERLQIGGPSDRIEAVRMMGVTGYAALNHGVLRGARKIYLLGYDCRERKAPGATHHFDDSLYPGQKNSDRWLKWAKDFDDMPAFLERCGAQVVNGCADSAITAFPRCDPAAVLDLLAVGRVAA